MIIIDFLRIVPFLPYIVVSIMVTYSIYYFMRKNVDKYENTNESIRKYLQYHSSKTENIENLRKIFKNEQLLGVMTANGIRVDKMYDRIDGLYQKNLEFKNHASSFSDELKYRIVLYNNILFSFVISFWFLLFLSILPLKMESIFYLNYTEGLFFIYSLFLILSIGTISYIHYFYYNIKNISIYLEIGIILFTVLFFITPIVFIQPWYSSMIILIMILTTIALITFINAVFTLYSRTHSIIYISYFSLISSFIIIDISLLLNIMVFLSSHM